MSEASRSGRLTHSTACSLMYKSDAGLPWPFDGPVPTGQGLAFARSTPSTRNLLPGENTYSASVKLGEMFVIE